MEISVEEYNELLEYRRIKEMQIYANEFFEKIKNEVFIYEFHNVMLPMVFQYGKFEGKKETVVGHVKAIGKDVPGFVIVVRCDLCFSEEVIKTAIRHEIIHFMLECLNLDSRDNSAIFYYLAITYNAKPYVYLEYLQRKILSQLNDILVDMQKIIQMDSDKTIRYCFSNIMKMIGKKDICSDRDIYEIVEKVKKEYEVVKYMTSNKVEI